MKSIEQLKRAILNYQPTDDLEVMDKEIILSLLGDPKILTREQLSYHITSSCWVMNQDYTKTLMIYHNIYQSWSWIGGHNDGNADCFAVAKKELEEESGIKHYSKSSSDIFSIEIGPVFQHMKNGSWVSSHLHLNLTYLFIVDETEPLILNKEETSGVKWVNINEMDQIVKDKNMLTIYHKFLNKLKLKGIKKIKQMKN